MRITAVRVAVAALALNLVGAVLAVILDLPAQFTTQAEPRQTVGADVLVIGSAISAPWPPLLALIIGILLAIRTGVTRATGLVILLLIGVVMSVGWIGEHAAGIPFTGARYAVFWVFSVMGFIVSVMLVTIAAVDLSRRQSPGEPIAYYGPEA